MSTGTVSKIKTKSSKIIYLAGLFIALLLSSFSFAAAGELNEFKVVMDDGHKLTLYSRVAENPKASILLIHGRTWSALPDFDLVTPNENLSMMQALKKEGMAVYAVDLRGYGKTPRDSSGWNTPNRAAKDISIIIKDIAKRHPEIKGTTVFGWSYGSMVAMLTAQQYPQNINGIILYGFPINTELVLDNGPDEIDPPKIATTAKAAAEDFILPGTISKEAIDAYVTAALKADPVRMDWHQLAQWNQLDGSNVEVPTLLLQADSDPYVNWDADGKLFKKFANNNKQWIILANADHAALLESARFRLYDSVVGFMNWIVL